MLLLDASLHVLAASASFRDTFAPADEPIDGRRLFDVDAKTWNVPQLSLVLSQLSSANPEGCCELDFVSHDDAACLIALNVQKILCTEHQAALLLITITDLTDRRAEQSQRRRLQQEKASLVREVLRQRAQLEDLCASVGVSINSSPAELSLCVLADDSVSNPRLSAALGSIVTGMVMQALREAHPDSAPVAVHLEHHANGPGWALRLRAPVSEQIPYEPEAAFMVSLSVEANDALHLTP
ncbi:MAG: hypothetical protein K2P70_04940 [Hyphomonadaceae bacterium]|nr:hypothetical protein [Hyphomonadaceae bacterium]